MPRQSPFVIELTESERTRLEAVSRKYTSPYFQVMRARVILLAAQGLRNDEIAHRLEMTRPMVSKWRKRFFEQRLAGLEDRPRSGRPARFSPQRRR